jgi:hypothetical protein
MPSEKSSSPEELVFKPNYPPHIRFTVYLYPIGVIICIFFIYLAFNTQRIFPYSLFALVFGLTTLTMPLVLFREVRFNDAIKVKRFFLPTRTINYEDVVTLTSQGLVAKKGGIPLANVRNRDEFEKIIKNLANRKVIHLEKGK